MCIRDRFTRTRTCSRVATGVVTFAIFACRLRADAGIAPNADSRHRLAAMIGRDMPAAYKHRDAKR